MDQRDRKDTNAERTYTCARMDFFWIHKKVHWGDTDAAGIVWFPNFFGWFEDAEEEMYAALGTPRQQFLDRYKLGMPRVEAQSRFASPLRAGDTIRIGIMSRVENPRRIRHEFQIREDATSRLVATGVVRVASIELGSFKPCDLPQELTDLLAHLPHLIARQSSGEVSIPWT
jgi:4-hydroxybenzoyl-CoA thioesterase